MLDRHYYYYSIYFPSGKVEAGYLTKVNISAISTSFELIVNAKDNNWLDKIHNGVYEKHTICNLPIRLQKVTQEDIVAHLMERLADLKEKCQRPVYAKKYEVQLAQFKSEEEIVEKIRKYVV